ncbi:MAG: hypothetical protein ACOC5T_02455 [Elusimicrobiota bacterium]
MFGYVKLKGLGCGLLGVWDGMHDSEFEEGKVRVVGECDSESLNEMVKISSKLKNVV